MNERERNGVPYLSYELFDDAPGVLAAASTRLGGVSDGAYASLNLGLHVGDRADRVLENRSLLCRALGIEAESLVLADQVHGSRVARVEKRDRGRGAFDRFDSIPASDALVSDVPGAALMILVADCVVVLLYDPQKHAAGIAHASWRGTLEGITQETVRTMQRLFASRPEELLAGISPSIGPCCYEVGEDVGGLFRKRRAREAERILAYPSAPSIEAEGTGIDSDSGHAREVRPHLDLWEANRMQLLFAGLVDENIETAKICTSCNSDRFYSYRRERGETGRFCGLVMLR